MSDHWYGIFKMKTKVRETQLSPAYRSKLEFWRTLEFRYFAQRQKWLDANSQMLAAKTAAERARRECELANRARENEITARKEPFEDEDNIEREIEAKFDNRRDENVEEFSDVDDEAFADPVAQYYTSLTSDEWQKIKNDITAIHMRPATNNRGFYRKLIWIANIVIVLFCVASYLLMQVMTPTVEKQPEDVQTCPKCLDGVDVPLRGLINILFPPCNENDETSYDPLMLKNTRKKYMYRHITNVWMEVMTPTVQKHPEEVQTCPECLDEVDVPLRGLINMLFPASNENDEI